jgi:dolichol-phosphate mannosyltransferase
MQQPSISLIYLCLNEERSLPAVLQEAQDYCVKGLRDWEILLVDDGSTDRSAEIVREFAQREPRIRLIQHPRNLGMGAGLRTGIAASTKDYFCMLAADGQIAPWQIDKMIPGLASAPIVLSTYVRRPDEWYRIVLSRGFRLYMRGAVGVSFALEGTYLFPTALARDEIGLDSIGAETFFFSFELVARALQRGIAVADSVIECRPRTDGTPSRIANLKQIQRVAGEVWQFRLRQRRAGKSPTP